ncbi:MAG: hypothetical protein JWP29_4838 [Rhodoferax sp.]|nr:hypothetical protein [Rhodoferax sp.]
MTKEEKEELARRRGRPSLPAEEKGVGSTIRLTPARWAKLRALGTDWLNRVIDKAKLPNE